MLALDAETHECLYYEPSGGFPTRSMARIPREVLAGHAEVDLRSDLIDCGIDVCSVDVPALFQDNFDYQDLRRDFVHGVLTSDLLMKSIHCYVVQEGYAARVRDTRSYDAIRCAWLEAQVGDILIGDLQQGYPVEVDVPSGSR